MHPFRLLIGMIKVFLGGCKAPVINQLEEQGHKKDRQKGRAQ
ncbi:MAG: hypothetical protein RL748_2679, partial [Pseudomonadota bacterium]